MSIVNITSQNLEKACKLLLEKGIVKAGRYPKAFKNYPASFGAAVTQCGIWYAVTLFENPGNSEARRDLLPKLIVEYLLGESKNRESLLSELLKNGKASAREILDAAAVFKVALRMYEPSDEEDVNFSKKEDSGSSEKNHTNNLAQNFYRYDCLENPNKINDAMEINKNTIYELENSAGFNAKIIAKVAAPGLIIGSGIAHSSQYENGIKTGLQFDPISGLPYIPGSSVKGVLRSAFKCKDYIKEILGSDVNDLEEKIFNNADVFADALITALPSSQYNKNENILSDDYITPHRNALENPIPIHIVKVSPGVEFTFLFRLSDNALLASKKLELFERILSDLGIGAKTNVGYGRLEDIKGSIKD